MISELAIVATWNRFQSAYFELNAHYLYLVAKHIGDIGKLSPTDVHRVTQILRMNKNTADVQKAIAVITKKTVAEIETVMETAAKSEYGLAKALYRGKEQVPFAKNKTMQGLLAAEIARTQWAIVNISRTTAQTLGYTRLVDAGIRAVSTGLQDYHSVIRWTVKQFAARGITTIDSASGYSRRLDSAVRMNVLEGVRTMAIEVAQEAGKEYGADGVEISAHAISAPDHEHIQGQQFTLAEFERLQATLDRPIGELNCRHIAFPIVLGISQPAYSQEQLRTFSERSNELIDGKSRYEWTQEQRRMETQIRATKDQRDFFKASGDAVGARAANSQAKSLTQEYQALSNKIGVEMRKDLLR